MSAVTRRTSNGTAAAYAILLVLVVTAAAALIPSVAEWLTTGELTPSSPLPLLYGQAAWTPQHTTAAVLLGAALAVVLTGAAAAAVAARRGKAKEDRAAVHMGRGESIAPLLPRRIAKLHKDLGMDPKVYRGMSLGSCVADGAPLRASYESSMVVLAGPGRQKSTALVIPNVLDAPGPVFSTSLKPDVREATSAYRSTVGTIHVFDPQGRDHAAAAAAVWWNPLAGVRTIEDADDLASVLSAAQIDDAGGNRIWETRGMRLLADYLFAAAHTGEYLPTVFHWLARDDSRLPVDALKDSYPELATRIEVAQAVNDRARDGVFMYARGAVEFIASRQLASWVQPGDGRREFSPEDFVRSARDTLYLISQEGAGSAAPLVSALTKAVLDAAERYSETRPNGRLIPPLSALLDEAGNICRIPDLPDRLTHYRSRGIVVMVVLQNWEQGEIVWPNGGFAKMWSASTIQVFAGGNASVSFCRDLSERIGDYEYVDRSTSSGSNGGSSQLNRRTERIMDVRDLGALSLGRMIVTGAGCRPTLARTTPWFKDKRLKALVEMQRPAANAAHTTTQQEDTDA